MTQDRAHIFIRDCFLDLHLSYDIGSQSVQAGLDLASCCLSILRRMCLPLSFSPSLRTRGSDSVLSSGAASSVGSSLGLANTAGDARYNCDPEGSGFHEGSCLHSDDVWVFEKSKMDSERIPLSERKHWILQPKIPNNLWHWEKPQAQIRIRAFSNSIGPVNNILAPPSNVQ